MYVYMYICIHIYFISKKKKPSMTSRCAPWLCFIPIWHDSFLRGTWLFRMCDSFIRVTWLVLMCDMTDSYVWRDLFSCVTWLNPALDVAHSYVCLILTHDNFWCVIHSCVTLILMCDMTRSCEWHDPLILTCNSFLCVMSGQQPWWAAGRRGKVGIDTHTHAHTHTHTCTYAHIHTHTYMYIYIYTQTNNTWSSTMMSRWAP